MPADPIRVLVRVAEILEGLEIVYMTGGSVASSILGIPRSSQDVDIVVDLPAQKVPALAAAMRQEFYVDEEAMMDAVRRRACFNAIHLETILKVDVFVQRRDEFALEEMKRRRLVEVLQHPQRNIYIASPEDVILHKLVWYKMSGEVSERQWHDAAGVIKVQGERLDFAYMRTWASRLGVHDLLDRALAENVV